MARKKIKLHLALILCIGLFFSVLSGSVPSHTTDFYVNDYADVLSDETESHIMSTAVQLENETSAQVVVLTVTDLNGEDILDFAVDTFRSWGIGDKDADNGVLIVLSVGDREMWVTTGYGVEGTLTDTRLGQLRDTYAIPYYSNDDFDTGTKLLFDAIVNELRTEEYGLTPLVGYEYSNNTDTIELSQGDIKLFLLIFSSPFLLIGFVMLCQFFKYLHLLRYDKKHGTNKAPVYRQKYMGARQAILYLIVRSALRGGVHSGRGGPHGGGFGGGGGFRGGGGSTGGGGAGGRF